MSVNVGENGRRSVQVEAEVPGSPEQVWEAIATGPGISSWFVPTEVEEREGGAVTANFGPGMESVSKITEWDPPRSFVAEGNGMTPDAPPMATQWVVEAKSGGMCVVRVVHSWFASTDEWDGQFASVETGWKAFFKILRLKLEHFPGQRSAAFDTAGMGNGSEAEVWEALAGPFGLTNAAVGQEVRPQSDAPALAGAVEVADLGGEKHLMVLTQKPGPGICHFLAMPMGGMMYLSIRFFLFGDTAAAIAADAGPEWNRWFAERFPMGG